MPAASRILAGGNNTRMFSVTDGTTPTVASSIAFSIVGEITSAGVSRDDATGQYNVSIEHVYDTSTLQTYLDTYINVTTSTAIQELMTEDGVKELAATSSNQKQLVIIGGGLQGGPGGTARKVFVGPQKLKSGSGAYTQTAEQWNKVTLAFEGYKLGGAVTIPSSFFSSISVAPSAVNLSTSLPYGTVVYQ